MDVFKHLWAHVVSWRRSKDADNKPLQELEQALMDSDDFNDDPEKLLNFDSYKDSIFYRLVRRIPNLGEDTWKHFLEDAIFTYFLDTGPSHGDPYGQSPSWLKCFEHVDTVLNLATLTKQVLEFMANQIDSAMNEDDKTPPTAELFRVIIEKLRLGAKLCGHFHTLFSEDWYRKDKGTQTLFHKLSHCNQPTYQEWEKAGVKKTDMTVQQGRESIIESINMFPEDVKHKAILYHRALRMMSYYHELIQLILARCLERSFLSGLEREKNLESAMEGQIEGIAAPREEHRWRLKLFHRPHQFRAQTYFQYEIADSADDIATMYDITETTFLALPDRENSFAARNAPDGWLPIIKSLATLPAWLSLSKRVLGCVVTITDVPEITEDVAKSIVDNITLLATRTTTTAAAGGNSNRQTRTTAYLHKKFDQAINILNDLCRHYKLDVGPLTSLKTEFSHQTVWPRCTSLLGAWYGVYYLALLTPQILPSYRLSHRGKQYAVKTNTLIYELITPDFQIGLLQPKPPDSGIDNATSDVLLRSNNARKAIKNCTEYMYHLGEIMTHHTNITIAKLLTDRTKSYSNTLTKEEQDMIINFDRENHLTEWMSKILIDGRRGLYENEVTAIDSIYSSGLLLMAILRGLLVIILKIAKENMKRYKGELQSSSRALKTKLLKKHWLKSIYDKLDNNNEAAAAAAANDNDNNTLLCDVLLTPEVDDADDAAAAAANNILSSSSSDDDWTNEQLRPLTERNDLLARLEEILSTAPASGNGIKNHLEDLFSIVTKLNATLLQIQTQLKQQEEERLLGMRDLEQQFQAMQVEGQQQQPADPGREAEYIERALDRFFLENLKERLPGLSKHLLHLYDILSTGSIAKRSTSTHLKVLDQLRAQQAELERTCTQLLELTRQQEEDAQKSSTMASKHLHAIAARFVYLVARRLWEFLFEYREQEQTATTNEESDNKRLRNRLWAHTLGKNTTDAEVDQILHKHIDVTRVLNAEKFSLVRPCWKRLFLRVAALDNRSPATLFGAMMLTHIFSPKNRSSDRLIGRGMVEYLAHIMTYIRFFRPVYSLAMGLIDPQKYYPIALGYGLGYYFYRYRTYLFGEGSTLAQPLAKHIVDAYKNENWRAKLASSLHEIIGSKTDNGPANLFNTGNTLPDLSNSTIWEETMMTNNKQILNSDVFGIGLLNHRKARNYEVLNYNSFVSRYLIGNAVAYEALKGPLFQKPFGRETALAPFVQKLNPVHDGTALSPWAIVYLVLELTNGILTIVPPIRTAIKASRSTYPEETDRLIGQFYEQLDNALWNIFFSRWFQALFGTSVVAAGATGFASLPVIIGSIVGFIELFQCRDYFKRFWNYSAKPFGSLHIPFKLIKFGFKLVVYAKILGYIKLGLDYIGSIIDWLSSLFSPSSAASEQLSSQIRAVFRTAFGKAFMLLLSVALTAAVGYMQPLALLLIPLLYLGLQLGLKYLRNTRFVRERSTLFRVIAPALGGLSSVAGLWHLLVLLGL